MRSTSSIFKTDTMEQEDDLKTAVVALITSEDLKYSELKPKHYRQLALSVGVSKEEVKKMLLDMEKRWGAFKEFQVAKGSAIKEEDGFFVSKATARFWDRATKEKRNFLQFRSTSLSTIDYANFTIIFKDYDFQSIFKKNISKEGFGDSEEEFKSRWSQGKTKSTYDSAARQRYQHSSGKSVGFSAASSSDECYIEETLALLKQLGMPPALLTSILAQKKTQKFFLSLKDEATQLKFLHVLKLNNS